MPKSSPLSAFALFLALIAIGCSSTRVLVPESDRGHALDGLSAGDQVVVRNYGEKSIPMRISKISGDSLYGDGKALAAADIDTVEKSEFSPMKTLGAVLLIPVAGAAAMMAALVGVILFGGGSYGC
jgi:hypothetical protein